MYPYKTHMFLTLLDTEAFPRYALSRVLRFWTTPKRERTCSCGDHTTDISHHLLFNCRNTLDKVKSFASTLKDPDLIANFSSNNLDKFLIKISSSVENLKCFNLMLGEFDYPRF